MQQTAASSDSPQVLGYDAAGIVREVGPKVSRFAPGDQVFYAGPNKGLGFRGIPDEIDSEQLYVALALRARF